jgi:hypothetical protein
VKEFAMFATEYEYGECTQHIIDECVKCMSREIEDFIKNSSEKDMSDFVAYPGDFVIGLLSNDRLHVKDEFRRLECLSRIKRHWRKSFSRMLVIEKRQKIIHMAWRFWIRSKKR